MAQPGVGCSVAAMTVDAATPDPDTITKSCARCGVAFTYQRSRGHGQRRYCSPACRNATEVERLKSARAALYRRQPASCLNCGKAIGVEQGVGRPKSVYCSAACKEERRATRQKADRVRRHGERLCKVCGTPISIRTRGDAVTCSTPCSVRYGNATRAERARVARGLRTRPPCPVCGSPLAPERHRNAIYCSEACKRIAVAITYRARHPDAALARFQMQPGDYEAMLAAQGGRCAICGATEAGGKGGRFHVDHDHITGRVRGLLCHACNFGIGLLRDEPEVMRAAIRYIEREA